jgi:predicted dehydrogenase
MLLDWGCHHVDIACWGLGLDDTGPFEVEGRGEFDTRHPVWNTIARFHVTARYAGGVEMIISGGYDEFLPGTKWIGEDGWIWVDRSGIDAQPRSLLTSRAGPNEVHLPQSAGHHEQFIDCVRTRGRTLTPAGVALRSTTPCWLGTIAITLGRKIRWDPVKMCILGDPAGERLLSRPMRNPWNLDWNQS